MSTYSQLSREERCTIARLREAGQSIRQIAAALDRQPSTVSREMKRNSGSKVGYRPAYAHAQADARRWNGTRLEREDDLRETILDRLADGCSPEQISGRLACEAGYRVISHETIYRFVYAHLKRTNDRRWRFYLPRARHRRGWRTKGGWPRIADRPSIHDRPPDIATREQPGHWEADAMLFSRTGQAILVAHERHSRLTIAVRQDSLKADPVAATITRMLRPLPAHLRRSITFDNGTEFYRLSRIASQIGGTTWFCDPHAPGRKAASKTPSDASDVTSTVKPTSQPCPANTPKPSSPRITTRPENTPRKCLGFKTPAETFNPLRFVCESTPGSSPG